MFFLTFSLFFSLFPHFSPLSLHSRIWLARKSVTQLQRLLFTKGLIFKSLLASKGRIDAFVPLPETFHYFNDIYDQYEFSLQFALC